MNLHDLLKEKIAISTKSFVKVAIASNLLLFNASIIFLNAVNVQFADET
jgi:hypothetical protein